MQFTVNNSDLVEALGWVAKSLPARPSVPVLAGVKIVVTGNQLVLSAFDYEQSAVATLDVDTTVEGSTVVSGRLLADIARALPKTDVTFSLEGTKLHLRAKSSKFNLQVMPEGDYPTLPTNPPPVAEVEAQAFADAVRMVVPAAGKDEMLPVLTAVAVMFDPAAGQITLSATDRFRLAIAKVPFQSPMGVESEPVTVLVPARVLDSWAKALASSGQFTIGAGGTETNVFSITAGSRSATVRPLEGKYPNVTALIPAEFKAEAHAEAVEVLAAVKRVGLVAQGAAIKVLFSTDGITVFAQGDDEASEDVDGQHEGEDIEMGFKDEYLQAGLTAIGGAMRVSLVARNKPVVFQPAESADFTYLLMPMRTN